MFVLAVATALLGNSWASAFGQPDAGNADLPLALRAAGSDEAETFQKRLDGLGIQAHRDKRDIIRSVSLEQLRSTESMDEALDLVASFQGLRSLYLERLPVNTSHLSDLGGLRNLERLYLDETAITDASAPQIAQFPKLQWLSVADTALSDAAIDDLITITSLQRIDLQGSRVTEVGVARLREAIPAATINTPEGDVIAPQRGTQEASTSPPNDESESSSD